jgi:D-beta-D-heptose 7-phosphate kinase/D-beta-D-heptose 1-phosphate adenosyltransferase
MTSWAERFCAVRPVRALVLGDVMLDRYAFGDAQRLSPEAPVPVVLLQHTEDRPGGAANVALNMAALGAQTTLLGAVGDDAAGRRLTQLLAVHAALEPRLLTHPGPTTVKWRIIARQQQLLRLDVEQPIRLDTQALQDTLAQALAEAPPDVVLFSDYAKGTLANPRPCLDLVQRCGIMALADSKAGLAPYAGLTALTPNRLEFTAATGLISGCNDETLRQQAMAMRHSLGLQVLVVTLGAAGMLFADALGTVHLKTHAQEVYDVTGAGDTVLAHLAHGLAGGLPPLLAAALANRAASLSVAHLGACSITPTALLDSLNDVTTPPGHKVISLDAACQQVAAARLRGARIVVTNGCFDGLHPGHLASLAWSKALGDHLVVLANDDASLRRLKGLQRPFVAQEQRLLALAELPWVDWVIPFGEETPEQAITALAPDVLTKGEEYRDQPIAGARQVTEGGGRVVLLPRLPGWASSAATSWR